MNVDVYDGTIGVMFNKSKLEFMLNEYYVTGGDGLNYEIKQDKTKVMVIVGKNDLEKELPMWSHPLIFTNAKHETVIALDLRPYMGSKVNDIVTIKEKLQDKYNGTLQLYRLIYTKLILDNDTDWLPYVKQELMEALSAIIKTTTSMILYDSSFDEYIGIITKIHFLSLLDEQENDLDKIMLKLPRKDLSELTHGSLKDFNRLIHQKYNDDKLIIPSTTIGSLTHNIIEITSGRAKGLTPDIYIQSLSRGFFSLDTKYQAIAMLEDLPTLIAVLTMVITEGINSKMSFRKIIDSNKRTIKPKDFTKIIVKRYQEEFVDL